jgi:hypothetical protein
MKQWLVCFAVFAAIAAPPTSARAQHIIHIPSSGEPDAEPSPPPREQAVEDQMPRPWGCRLSTVEDETPLGKRTITRTDCD